VFRWSLVVVAVGLLGLLACKKSVEGESKAWTANVAKVKQLGALYPGFQPALDERVKAAQAIYDGASGLAEEQAAEKMAAANSTLVGGFVGKLDGLDKRMKGLRTKLVDAATAAGDDSDRLGVKVVADAATKTLEQVDAALKAGAKDVAGAEVVVTKLEGDLVAAEKDVDKVIGAVQAKKAEAAAAKDEQKVADEKKEQAAAPWTCEYCSGSNEASLTQCSSCGAARPAPKQP
jgi:predicted transcriptional regulator